MILPDPHLLHSALPQNQQESQTFWRPLRYFSYYRIIVACLFLGSVLIWRGAFSLGTEDPQLFLLVCGGYLLGAVIAIILQARWQQAFNLQLSLQVALDLQALTLLLHASGGVQSGLAMMMLVVLVGAGLVGQGRLVLFYAAMATVFLLVEQSIRVLRFGDDPGDFFRSGLVSIGFFVSAVAARLLARRIVANEALALQRGIELADQMRINERVIRDMQDGVLVVDAAGRVRQVNSQTTALLGMEEPVSPMLASYSPELAKAFLTRSNDTREFEHVLQIPQSGRLLRARFLPPREGGNTLIFLEDLGRLRQEAQQVKLAALGRLTANMAHEIRNPLAAISHAAELLNEGETDKARQRLLSIIGNNTHRLNHLVVEVMELGRRDHASPETLPLRQSIGYLLEELSLRDQDGARRVVLELPEEVAVCFDRGHFHRVLSNLIENALRYASSSAGAVRILAAPAPAQERLEIHVIDDGPGIDASERERVFEPFFTTRATGTGLGLYIARELCEANGARILLRENAPGAHFCISCRSSCEKTEQDFTT